MLQALRDRMLEELSAGKEVKAMNLAEELGVCTETVQDKIRILVREGIVAKRRKGSGTVYYIPDGKIIEDRYKNPIARRVEVGDSILYSTIKACDVDSANARSGFDRYATVIAKYPKFALVVLPSGVKDSVNWMDVKKIKKAKKPGGTSHGKEL